MATPTASVGWLVHKFANTSVCSGKHALWYRGKWKVFPFKSSGLTSERRAVKGIGWRSLSEKHHQQTILSRRKNIKA
jgi:hypothetical protein